MQDFEGKVAIVTGAADGIGETVAETLYARGASVVIASRSADKTREKAKALDPSGRRSLGLACDVSDPEQVGTHHGDGWTLWRAASRSEQRRGRRPRQHDDPRHQH
jgi:NAD(P)-dependent dehydrogenase (short-subunit alcohol dehydrogenase family)